MTHNNEGIRKVSSALLVVFLVIVTIYLWLLDLVVDQRIFATLLSAELIAFSMLVYVSTRPFTRSWLVVGYFTIALLLSMAVGLSSPTSTPQVAMTTTSTEISKIPTVQLTLYAGETGTRLGFGLSRNNITSPGPTLKFRVGDVVHITLVNVGQLSHNFAVTDAAKEGATVLFNAQIASADNPLPPGGSGSITFTPDKAGEYYYICQVPGHVSLGMWGRVTIEAPASATVTGPSPTAATNATITAATSSMAMKTKNKVPT
jgi:uncharacterized cupredoxin-like copper-binding protein